MKVKKLGLGALALATLMLAACQANSNSSSASASASTAAQSTAAQSTAAQSTAAQSTAAQSTAAQSTAAQSTAAQSTAADSGIVDGVFTVEDTAASWSDYVLAEDNEKITIEGYITARHTWWQNSANFYLQGTESGEGYYLYGLQCTETQYNNDLKVGNKIRVTGLKGSYSGEQEINASVEGSKAGFKVVSTEASPIVSPISLTADDFNQDSVINYMNCYVTINATVNAHSDNKVVYYKWDNSGADGDDLYVNFNVGSTAYEFVVESYMESSQKTSTVYATVKELTANTAVSLKGILYYYDNKPQLQIVAVNFPK